MDQLSSPLMGVLGLGAAMSVAMGALGDVAMIASVIVANAAVGVWQENRAQTASRALRALSARSARVLRDGRPETVANDALVPGDVILLASGDRVPADARVISTDPFEVDEAALTGELLDPPAERFDARRDAERLDRHVGRERVPLQAVESQHLLVHGGSPSSSLASSLGR